VPKHQAFEESPAIDQGVAAPFPRGLLAEQRDEVRQRVAVDLEPWKLPVVQTWQKRGIHRKMEDSTCFNMV